MAKKQLYGSLLYPSVIGKASLARSAKKGSSQFIKHMVEEAEDVASSPALQNFGVLAEARFRHEAERILSERAQLPQIKERVKPRLAKAIMNKTQGNELSASAKMDVQNYVNFLHVAENLQEGRTTSLAHMKQIIDFDSFSRTGAPPLESIIYQMALMDISRPTRQVQNFVKGVIRNLRGVRPQDLNKALLQTEVVDFKIDFKKYNKEMRTTSLTFEKSRALELMKDYPRIRKDGANSLFPEFEQVADLTAKGLLAQSLKSAGIQGGALVKNGNSYSFIGEVRARDYGSLNL